MWRVTRWTSMLAAALSFAAVNAAGQDAIPTAEAPAATHKLKFILGNTSRLALHGDSTLHPYSSQATLLGLKASVELPAEAQSPHEGLREALRSHSAAKVELRIPVTGLKSGDRNLDKAMYDLLRHKEHPDITFRLERYELVPGTPAKDTYPLHVYGTLRVAGRERPVQLNVTGTFHDNELRLAGTTALKMSDFGIDPPTFFLVVKTEDRLEIRFDLSVQPSSGSLAITPSGALHEARR